MSETEKDRYAISTWDDIACSHCPYEGRVKVSIDRLSGVAGFRCPDCGILQEP